MNRMRRSLTVVCLVAVAALANAQDFATRYMGENRCDTVLKCISIGPKMISVVLNAGAQNEEQEQIKAILSNLKSMQIVTSTQNGEAYYEKAEQMAQKNTNRFEQYLAFDNENEEGKILLHRRDDSIVELVMYLHRKEFFQVIDFTGDMDDEFIDRLSKTIVPQGEDEK